VILPDPASPQAQSLARALGLTTTIGDVLHRRGHGDDERTRRFLEPKLAHLSGPAGMAGREEAVERIAHAVRARERIVVFGDYDCDGITSTAILTEIVGALGGNVSPMLADRFAGGYGVTERAADAILARRPRLLVTCDCGSSDGARLARIARAGADIVVIDHHLVPAEALPAVAFLNPNRAECGFAYKHLASCGLALGLGAGLRSALGGELDVREWLDLVAIGTVADVAPLDGDNRVLVRAGMRLLEAGRRPGLRKLAQLARIPLAAGVTAETIAFDIAPRLNAPGRLGSPLPALRLLLARDDEAAAGHATAIEQARQQRRDIQQRILADAVAEVESAGFDRDPAIVVGREGWHVGVVGIVASQLVDRYGKPAVVVAFEGGEGRGSARAPDGVPVYDLLSACREAPVEFGGHQAAAGVQLAPGALERLREMLSAAALAHAKANAGGDRGVEHRGAAEVRLDPGDAPNAVVADLSRLEPCGAGNPAPRIALAGARVSRAQAVRGGHLQLHLAPGGGWLVYGFAHSAGGRAAELGVGARVNAVGTLRRDTYRGGDAVGMRIEVVEKLG
jgi:single-stranded-DNA-specific exonuclease